ncbi:MAG: substrate-binding domain-containing protein [Clostridiales bacterium]|nr:substrate-binding domain-containing protein [Clostridiales bacterium]
MKFKKMMALVLSAAVVGSMALAGCGSTSSDSTTEDTTTTEDSSAAADTEEAEETDDTAEEASSDFDTSSAITVLSREDGSGTRGAFIELFGIEVTNEDGEKEDMTTVDATITNNTEVMMSTVAGDTYAIGYCSLGSLNDSVKAVQIDGVDATVENVADGSYAVARPFNIVTQDNLSDVAQDFIDYIMSADGQAVISENGYIEVAEGEAFESSGASGSISVAGSSSVSPVMEKLKEAYEEINPNATVEIQTSDSTTGITNAIEGTCDIGMASRDLKDEETGVTATCIAMDGIAVIVNNDNPLTNLTSDDVNQIFTGEVTSWSEVE